MYYRNYITPLLILLALPAFLCQDVVTWEGNSNGSPNASANGNGSKTRIIGGEAVDITYYPYQASVQKYGYHSCGGSILSNYWILTSGSCVYNVDRNILTVRAGTTYRQLGGQVRALQGYAIHPYYNPLSFDYDFALLLVNYPFFYTSGLAPIQMIGYTLGANARLTITGWGQTQSEVAPFYLQRAYVAVTDWVQCFYQYGGRITPRMICGQYPGRDPCYGDGGGPAAATVLATGQPLLTGIISFSRGCANGIYPAVYSNVASVRPWIYSYTGF